MHEARRGMIEIKDMGASAFDRYGIAPRRRACRPDKAQQSTRGVTS
jgi:hypothetical protein